MFILVKYDGSQEVVRDFDQSNATDPRLKDIKEVLVVNKVLTKVTKWVAKSPDEHKLEGEAPTPLPRKKERQKRAPKE